MSGCALPVMTTSGSGNQGMTSSLALIEYANFFKTEHEKLIRALFFFHLATVHIKTNVGRLSAYCGVICSAAAVSGALAFINDESFEVVAHTIANTLGDVSGIICDGAKSSCVMKVATPSMLPLMPICSYVRESIYMGVMELLLTILKRR